MDDLSSREAVVDALVVVMRGTRSSMDDLFGAGLAFERLDTDPEVARAIGYSEGVEAALGMRASTSARRKRPVEPR